MELPVPGDFLCTDDQVLPLLRSVDLSKASGPDGMSTSLKFTAISIAPVIMKLFNLSLNLEKYLLNEKYHRLD